MHSPTGNQIGIALAAHEPNLGFFTLQLESIQKQTHQDWICIITFDSPLAPILLDPTMEIFKKDSRFTFIGNSVKLGHKKNFEKAIQICLMHGVDFIACSDQDDVWYPSKLEKSLETLRKQPSKALVHSDMHILLETDTLSETAWKLEQRGIQNNHPIHLYVRNIVAGCSMLFKATLADKFKVIPEGVEFHDHWYALAASYEGGITEVNQPLYAYRQHGQNEVGVSPFGGVTALPEKIGILGVLKKCKMGWRKSQNLLLSARNNGIRPTFIERLLFQYRFDLGIGLFLLGLVNLKKDAPIARACFARSIGKFLTTFS